MKHIITYIIFITSFLISCQKEEFTDIPKGMGALVLENLSVQTENVNTITTRAVANDLYVEIWQGGSLVAGQVYEPGKMPSKLNLPAGDYQLKTYNQAYKDMSSWPKSEKGNAAFYADKEFKIEEGRVSYFSLEVPMVNIGVSLRLPEGFSDLFSTYHFFAQVGERSVEILNAETAYFPLGKVTCTFSVVNSDSENKTNTFTIDSPKAGTIYEINYDYETKTLRVIE